MAKYKPRKLGKFTKTSLLLSNVIDADHQKLPFLDTKANLHHSYGFLTRCWPNFMSDILQIIDTLRTYFNCYFSYKILTHMSIMMHFGSLKVLLSHGILYRVPTQIVFSNYLLFSVQPQISIYMIFGYHIEKTDLTDISSFYQNFSGKYCNILYL